MDRSIRTDLPENTDNPSVSEERKLKIVRSLHRTNTLLGAYQHYFQILTPLIEHTSSVRNRPVRLLELASGSGELAMQLARMAAKKNLRLEVTGSDYVEAVVANANERAIKRAIPVGFRTINAFNMESVLSKGDYDIFLIVGSMHHFKPGKLAVMMAQSRRFSEPGSLFVGIDVYRSVPMILFLPISHFVNTLYELEQIARIALPEARIDVKHSFPGLSLFKAQF